MSRYHERAVGGHALSPQTLMMGYGYDPALSEGSIKVPLFQTSTFVFKSAEDGKRFFEVAYGLREKAPNEALGLIYSRINNPNLEILEDRLAIWDAAEKAIVFSSGMAAITTTLLTHARPGDTIAHSAPVYGGTEYLLDRILPQFGIESVAIRPLADEAEVSRTLDFAAAKAREKGGRLAAVHVETPANPTNELTDIAMVAAIARRHEAGGKRPVVTVDNTFLGPLWQQPVKNGADYSVYSLTKYVGGHSDIVAGACMGSAAAVKQVGEMRTILGTTLDPHSAWLLLRSLETMELRMSRAMANARVVAEFLRKQPKVKQVLHLDEVPKESEQARIFAKQCSGAGSTFSMRLKGGEAEAFRFLDALKIIKLAVSLGGTESLASHPASMTHSDYTMQAKQAYGITDDLVRISIGIEDPRDLTADIAQALAAV